MRKKKKKKKKREMAEDQASLMIFARGRENGKLKA